MSILDHIFLFLVLFGIFFFLTQIKQKTINNNYWEITFIPIIVYSLVLGCRYGWGNDFIWYKYRFEHPYGYEDENIGFRCINLFLNDIGFNYTGAFIIYSLIFIIGVYTLLRFYNNNKYMLFLFLPATVLFSTATIRESFAASFAYIAYYFFFKKNYIGVIISLLCMNSIHSAPFIPFFIIIGLYLFNKEKTISLRYSLIIYIGIFLFQANIEDFIIEPLNKAISYISFNNKYQGYIEQADYWFSEEGKNQQYEQSFLTSSLMFLFHISIIYIGYLGLKYRNNKYVRCFYHSVFVGLCMLVLFFQLEILRRIAEALVQMYYIPVGYSIATITLIKKTKINKEERFLYSIALGVFSVYLILYFGRFIFLSPTLKFYWNV